MGYRVAKLSELASYEFGNIEGAFAELSERELERVLPQGMALNSFKAQLQEGQLILLSDAPNTPALTLSSAPSGEKTWQFNTAAQSHFSPQAQTAFVSRTKAKGSSSRSGGSAGTQAASEPAYTPQPPVEDKPEKPGVNYEYLFEVACSEEVLASEVGCQFALGKTPKEASIVSWETKPSEHGTVFSAKATDGAPRKLIIKIANTEKGITRQEPVKLKPKDTGAVREAFIPVVPTVQLGSRLGFPTEGFYYHFHNNKLVQEYKVLGEDRWAFYATRSTHEKLNTEQSTNKYQGAILLYWKIDSKVVKGQHLVYLDQAITREQLDNLNDDWLAEHGAPIDVPALLATMQPQQAAEKPYKPQTFNAPANVVYDHKERLLMGSSLKAINNERLVESGLPVVNIVTLKRSLVFNGKQLAWIDHRGNIVQSYDAVSGKVGFQSKDLQNEKSKGPIPEGKWLVQQKKYQEIGERSVIEQLAAEVGRTAWPGGESSWGSSRVWLVPAEGTDTLERSGFSIHGGDTPGSAGCIDLTNNINDFSKAFKAYGKDLTLTVKY
ncbi:tlde1 domain-containing protein [Enterovibrio norvegicus]|uniref:tlde1 domain-containing protein n=1 Tax=Enterovibrio norvegicus TaxID=188144 RepID=UPI003899C961